MNVFIDGWGKPIGFLRWAPGATTWSDIQIDDTSTTNLHHDPFDPNCVQSNAYHLYPLIFAGVLDKKLTGTNPATNASITVDDYGIVLGNGLALSNGTDIDSAITAPTTNPFAVTGGTGAYLNIGTFHPGSGVPLIHNHHMDLK